MCITFVVFPPGTRRTKLPGKTFRKLYIYIFFSRWCWGVSRLPLGHGQGQDPDPGPHRRRGQVPRYIPLPHRAHQRKRGGYIL